MLTNGWRTAEPDEYRAYIRLGSLKHQFELAKLHPYIVPNHELEGVWKDLVKVFNELPGSSRKKLSDPRNADRSYVKILHELIAAENCSVYDH